MKLGTRQRLRYRGLDDALLPLVNVVFLLMVFVLAAGRPGSLRPTSTTPQSRQAEESRIASRVLELRGQAQLAVQGEVFADAELPGRSLAWKGSALDVRAAGDVPAERVLRVLAVLRAAGITDVRLLTLRQGGAGR